MGDLNTYYNICNLFDQLGLPSDAASIDAFFEQHTPFSEDICLWDAPWWTPGQAEFLKDALLQDANWQIAVDELNTRLRKT